MSNPFRIMKVTYTKGVVFMKTNIYELLEKEIMSSDVSEEEKNRQLSKLLKARGQKINLMLVGATGSGKSSTINSLFNTSVAKVGVGVDPETKDIECYQMENLTIWDSPGLGDSIEKDEQYAQEIAKKLAETDEEGNSLIDLVVSKNGKPLDRSNIWKMLKNLCEDAGVSKDKVFPHNFRHLFARTYYSIEKDVVRLADILGHSSVNTTRIYTMETGDVHRMQLQKLGLLLC